MEGELTTAGCRAVADRATPAATTRPASPVRVRPVPALSEDESARVGPRRDRDQPVVRDAGQPARSQPRARRLFERIRRGGGHRRGRRRLRQRHRGLLRIPAACCGTAGLKTTWGRIPLDGVWPLAPSFDTVGPMARTVAGLVTGMELLEPGFSIAGEDGADLWSAGCPLRRTRPSPPRSTRRWVWWSGTGGNCDVPVGRATLQAGLLLVVEAWQSDGVLVAEDPEGISDGVRGRLELGGVFDDATSTPPGGSSGPGRRRSSGSSPRSTCSLPRR